jgi:predicted transcriptional regulator
MGATKRIQSAVTWADALGSAIADKAPPPEWKTVAQIAKEVGKSTGVIAHHVAKLVAAGKAERRVYRISVGARPFPVPHYRLIGK